MTKTEQNIREADEALAPKFTVPVSFNEKRALDDVSYGASQHAIRNGESLDSAVRYVFLQGVFIGLEGTKHDRY